MGRQGGEVPERKGEGAQGDLHPKPITVGEKRVGPGGRVGCGRNAVALRATRNSDATVE